MGCCTSTDSINAWRNSQGKDIPLNPNNSTSKSQLHNGNDDDVNNNNNNNVEIGARIATTITIISNEGKTENKYEQTHQQQQHDDVLHAPPSPTHCTASPDADVSLQQQQQTQQSTNEIAIGLSQSNNSNNNNNNNNSSNNSVNPVLQATPRHDDEKHLPCDRQSENNNNSSSSHNNNYSNITSPTSKTVGGGGEVAPIFTVMKCSINVPGSSFLDKTNNNNHHQRHSSNNDPHQTVLLFNESDNTENKSTVDTSVHHRGNHATNNNNNNNNNIRSTRVVLNSGDADVKTVHVNNLTSFLTNNNNNFNDNSGNVPQKGTTFVSKSKTSNQSSLQHELYEIAIGADEETDEAHKFHFQGENSSKSASNQQQQVHLQSVDNQSSTNSAGLLRNHTQNNNNVSTTTANVSAGVVVAVVDDDNEETSCTSTKNKNNNNNNISNNNESASYIPPSMENLTNVAGIATTTANNKHDSSHSDSRTKNGSKTSNHQKSKNSCFLVKSESRKKSDKKHAVGDEQSQDEENSKLQHSGEFFSRDHFECLASRTGDEVVGDPNNNKPTPAVQSTSEKTLHQKLGFNLNLGSRLFEQKKDRKHSASGRTEGKQKSGGGVIRSCRRKTEAAVAVAKTADHESEDHPTPPQLATPKSAVVRKRSHVVVAASINSSSRKQKHIKLGENDDDADDVMVGDDHEAGIVARTKSRRKSTPSSSLPKNNKSKIVDADKSKVSELQLPPTSDIRALGSTLLDLVAKPESKEVKANGKNKLDDDNNDNDNSATALPLAKLLGAKGDGGFVDDDDDDDDAEDPDIPFSDREFKYKNVKESMSSPRGVTGGEGGGGGGGITGASFESRNNSPRGGGDDDDSPRKRINNGNDQRKQNDDVDEDDDGPRSPKNIHRKTLLSGLLTDRRGSAMTHSMNNNNNNNNNNSKMHPTGSFSPRCQHDESGENNNNNNPLLQIFANSFKSALQNNNDQEKKDEKSRNNNNNNYHEDDVDDDDDDDFAPPGGAIGAAIANRRKEEADLRDFEKSLEVYQRSFNRAEIVSPFIDAINNVHQLAASRNRASLNSNIHNSIHTPKRNNNNNFDNNKIDLRKSGSQINNNNNHNHYRQKSPLLVPAVTISRSGSTTPRSNHTALDGAISSGSGKKKERPPLVIQVPDIELESGAFAMTVIPPAALKMVKIDYDDSTSSRALRPAINSGTQITPARLRQDGNSQIDASLGRHGEATSGGQIISDQSCLHSDSGNNNNNKQNYDNSASKTVDSKRRCQVDGKENEKEKEEEDNISNDDDDEEEEEEEEDEEYFDEGEEEEEDEEEEAEKNDDIHDTRGSGEDDDYEDATLLLKADGATSLAQTRDDDEDYGLHGPPSGGSRTQTLINLTGHHGHNIKINHTSNLLEGAAAAAARASSLMDTTTATSLTTTTTTTTTTSTSRLIRPEISVTAIGQQPSNTNGTTASSASAFSREMKAASIMSNFAPTDFQRQQHHQHHQRLQNHLSSPVAPTDDKSSSGNNRGNSRCNTSVGDDADSLRLLSLPPICPSQLARAVPIHSSGGGARSSKNNNNNNNNNNDDDDDNTVLPNSVATPSRLIRFSNTNTASGSNPQLLLLRVPASKSNTSSSSTHSNDNSNNNNNNNNLNQATGSQHSSSNNRIMIKVSQ